MPGGAELLCVQVEVLLEAWASMAKLQDAHPPTSKTRYGDGIVAVPGSPKPERDVRIVFTVPAIHRWPSSLGVSLQN